MLDTLEDDEMDLLAGSSCASRANNADSDDELEESPRDIIARMVRVFHPRRMLHAGEMSGALGDLGTFLPDVVALANNPHGPPVPVASMVFFSGV